MVTSPTSSHIRTCRSRAIAGSRHGWRGAVASYDATARAVQHGRSWTVAILGSKAPDGPTLTFAPAAWSTFLTALRKGPFPR
jgi:hypothetical protein